MKIDIILLLIGWVVLVLLKLVGVLTVGWLIVLIVPPLIFVTGIGIIVVKVLIK